MFWRNLTLSLLLYLVEKKSLLFVPNCLFFNSRLCYLKMWGFPAKYIIAKTYYVTKTWATVGGLSSQCKCKKVKHKFFTSKNGDFTIWNWNFFKISPFFTLLHDWAWLHVNLRKFFISFYLKKWWFYYMKLKICQNFPFFTLRHDWTLI